MNDKTSAKPDESGIVMQATNSVNIIPFDPNNSMNVNSWLKYFNDKCQEHNLDDKWKLNNITAYLKNNALTEYVNSYDTIKTWEEFISFLTERYISPNLVNLSDFTSKSFKEGDDITLYFQEKLKIGRQLNLATSMILEGLSDGLPVNLRQLLAIHSPNNPTEWLTTASKLIKIQKSDENQINSSHSATQNLKTNSVNGNQWQPRNFRPHNFTPRQNFRPNNFQPNSPPRQNFRQNNNYQTPPPRQAFRPFSNANTHFQEKLPPSACWLCTKQGIANAYHWIQTCPFGLSSGQLLSPNPAPPNFDPPKEENQQCQLPTVSGYYKRKPLPCVLDTGSTISLIPRDLVTKNHLKMINAQDIVVQQTRGAISLTKTCTFSLKIGTINKNVTMYVLDHTLPYIILGMPELSKYDITIDCSKQKICQNGKNLNKSQNNKNHSNDKDKQNVSLHISECKQINSHCSQTTEDQVNPPQSVTENKCELRKEVKDIIKNFDSVFSKDIDFRKLNALCKSDSEPLPLMDSLLDKLSKAKIFSSLDLASGIGMCPFTPKILKN
ncbi:hypothetical protein AVEN_124358-1 [Araneus ventricosus]|uniref:Retrotransposon gag domain-containing protein n=1 Tax=Araneus ventricosus TaxID=182803 RepID=A0A4Y2TVL4_ARAVE|nr:hypothetical protein AVEN_124358-1 [Araneus ventricosus]